MLGRMYLRCEMCGSEISAPPDEFSFMSDRDTILALLAESPRKITTSNVEGTARFVDGKIVMTFDKYVCIQGRIDIGDAVDETDNGPMCFANQIAAESVNWLIVADDKGCPVGIVSVEDLIARIKSEILSGLDPCALLGIVPGSGPSVVLVEGPGCGISTKPLNQLCSAILGG